MLACLLHAGVLEKIPLLPYTAHMINEPIQFAAERLNAISLMSNISPNLSTKFLDGRIGETDYENKFLLSAWGTLTARLDGLLAESVVKCLSGNDFTAEDIMCGTEPVTVYFRWSESDLSVLSPVVRLLWTSLIDGLTKPYDRKNGDNCKPVLLLIDEAGKTGVPYLPEHASTVTGRGISLWIAVQDLAQLEKLYGTPGAKTLKNNCDSQLFYRPNDRDTAKFIEECLGYKSEYARSQTSREGQDIAQGQSETGVPLLTAWDIQRLRDEQIICFHRNLPPFMAKRMDWRRFPLLVKRRAIPPPQLSALPQLDAHLPETAGLRPDSVTSWQLSPDLTRRGTPAPATNGFRKKMPEERRV
jgi:type IV secretion system protein VirD4